MEYMLVDADSSTSKPTRTAGAQGQGMDEMQGNKGQGSEPDCARHVLENIRASI